MLVRQVFIEHGRESTLDILILNVESLGIGQHAILRPGFEIRKETIVLARRNGANRTFYGTPCRKGISIITPHDAGKTAARNLISYTGYRTGFIEIENLLRPRAYKVRRNVAPP